MQAVALRRVSLLQGQANRLNSLGEEAVPGSSGDSHVELSVQAGEQGVIRRLRRPVQDLAEAGATSSEVRAIAAMAAAAGSSSSR